jgi:hypothetical protein
MNSKKKFGFDKYVSDDLKRSAAGRMCMEKRKSEDDTVSERLIKAVVLRNVKNIPKKVK